MKIEINDSKGSSLIAVLRLDGSPAVEGVDYALWEGEYIKNGKWSYTQGGVALKEGLVIVNKRSTHYNYDNRKWVIHIAENKVVDEYFVMGRFSETPERPKLPSSFPLGKEVWDKIIEAIIKWGNPEMVAQMLKKWEEMEKFL